MGCGVVRWHCQSGSINLGTEKAEVGVAGFMQMWPISGSPNQPASRKVCWWGGGVLSFLRNLQLTRSDTLPLKFLTRKVYNQRGSQLDEASQRDTTPALVRPINGKKSLTVTQ